MIVVFVKKFLLKLKIVFNINLILNALDVKKVLHLVKNKIVVLMLIIYKKLQI